MNGDEQEQVNCGWITADSAQTETRRGEWCNKKTSDVVDSCPVSCNFCGCMNNRYFKYDVLTTRGDGTQRKEVGCGWLTEPGITDQQSTNRYNNWCLGNLGNTNVREQCKLVCDRDTCGNPTGDCTDNPDFTFMVLTDNGDGQERKPVNCSWLTEDGITPTQQGNRFRNWCAGNQAVRLNCFETCNPDQCVPEDPDISVAPTQAVTQGCQNNPDFRFNVKTTNGDGTQTKQVGCGWLTEPGITETQLTNRFNRWCTTDNVSAGCPETCGVGCPSSAPSPLPTPVASSKPSVALSSEPNDAVPTPFTCTNTPNFQFDVLITNGDGQITKSVGCGWIVEQGITAEQTQRRYQNWCVNSDRVKNGCAQTCSLCSSTPSVNSSTTPSLASSSVPSPVLSSKPSIAGPAPVKCDNTENFKFEVKTTLGDGIQTKEVGCGWIVEQGITQEQKENRFKNWCLDSATVRYGCAGTCGVCSNSPSIQPSERIEDEKGTPAPGTGTSKGKGKGKAPSISPTISMMPSVSSSPSKSKGKKNGKGKAPSSSPTISMMPSVLPSSSPTISPSVSAAPSKTKKKKKEKKEKKDSAAPKTCKKPAGSESLSVSISFQSGPSLSLDDLLELCTASVRRKLRTLAEDEILSVAAKSLQKLEDGTYTGSFVFI